MALVIHLNKMAVINKNTMKKTKILIMFILISISCKKNDNNENINKPITDYRDLYEGAYLYTIHQSNESIIDGITFDTNYTVNGYVKKYGNINDSLIEIHYGTDTIFIINENGILKVLKENSNLKISLNNNISFPGGFGVEGHNFLYGKFYKNDSLELNISVGGLGSWETRVIKGYKQ